MKDAAAITLWIGVMLTTLTATANEETPDNSWWWSDAWWNDGQIAVPTNFAVETEWIAYQSGDTEVPAMVARPKQPARFPAVLFQHGRRGRTASSPSLADNSRSGFSGAAPP